MPRTAVELPTAVTLFRAYSSTKVVSNLALASFYYMLLLLDSWSPLLAAPPDLTSSFVFRELLRSV